MSFTNRHILPINNLEKKIWTLIIYDPIIINTNFPKVEQYYYESTIINLKKNSIIEEIFIYCKPNIFKYLIDLEKISSVKIINNIASKISIMQVLLNNSKNILWFENQTSYIALEPNNGFNDLDNIYSTLIPKKTIDSIYLSLMNKFNLVHIITTDLMIVPYHVEHHKFFENVFKTAKQIMTTEDIAINISLSIANKRTPFIKNLLHLPFYHNFISEKNGKILSQTRIEIFISQSNVHQIQPIAYDDPRYLYYPFLDCFTQSISHQFDIDNLPQVLNTNSFAINLGNKPIYPLLFKRFLNKKSGIFIKKNNNIQLIPKILHCINLNNSNLNNSNPQNFIADWGRILRKPWEYRIWSDNDIINEFNNSKWMKIYEKSNNSIKYWVSAIMILEKYGGITIDPYIIPFKIIPEEILKNYFVTSFLDEQNTGTKLSFRILASVPGKLPIEEQIIVNYDVARVQPKKVNNFFRNVEYLKNNTSIISKSICYPEIFDKLYNILSNDINDPLNHVNDFLLLDPKITIYPSYYFNQNISSIPECLSNHAICNTLWMFNEKENHIKTDIKRTYQITREGIISGLNKNPKDGLLRE